MIKVIFKAVSIGASVGAVVCLLLNVIDERNAIILLGLGSAALSIAMMGEGEQANEKKGR